MFSSIATFLLVFTLSWAALPGGLKPCKMSSKDFVKCMNNEVTKSLRVFKDGDIKMGVNPLDPFRFDRILIDQGKGPVAINLEFKKLSLLGISKGKIVNTKGDWKTLIFNAHLDNLKILGDYTISGKVLILPISGSGKSNITLIDLDIEIIMKLTEVSKGGKTYVNADSFALNISPKKTIFHFENLFNGDKALGDNMNLFLNENHEQIINELKPAISRSFSQGFLQVANQVYSKIPANEIKIK